MGTYYYGVCHTCSQRVGIGKKIWRLDPRQGELDQEEIDRLTRALAGDPHAEQEEEVSHGELAFELARLAAFVFEHGHHDLEILPDTDDATMHLLEVMESAWDDPLAHRREGAPRRTAPRVILDASAREKNAAEEALDAIATMCGCSEWEYPGQVVRDVKLALAKAVSDVVDLCNPCQSCGADPRESPASGEELPIIAGALDAQADAEIRAMSSARAAEDSWAAREEAEQRAELAARALEYHAWRIKILAVACLGLLVTVIVLALRLRGAA